MRLASNAQDNYGNIYFKTLSENFFSEDKRVEFLMSRVALDTCGAIPEVPTPGNNLAVRIKRSIDEPRVGSD